MQGRFGFVWKRPKCVPAKADAAALRAFLADAPAPLMARATAEPAPPLHVVDATRPAYDAHPACGWIRRGKTRRLKSNHGRVNVTMNGALSWPGREVVTREAERITGAEMIAPFEDLARRHPEARTITLVLDNATTTAPPASATGRPCPNAGSASSTCRPMPPNLKLVERLKWFFEEKQPWNRHYSTLADFKAAISSLFADLEPWKSELAPLSTDPFHFIRTERAQIAAA